MANLTPDTKDEQDSAYSPENLAQRESIPGYDRAGDGLDDHPISGGDSSGVDPNRSVKDQESNPQGLAPDFKNSFTGSGKSSPINGKLKLAKKFGPATGLTGVIVGLGMLGLSFTPATLLINLKENLVKKFDLQNTSMNVRTNKIIAKKLANTATSGSCDVIKIACRFNRPSNRLLAQLEKGGITPKKGLNTIEKKSLWPNTIPDTYEFTGSDGKLVSVDAKNFSKTLASNDEFRAAFHKAYNPRFVGYADNIFNKVMARFGVTKKSSVSGENDSKKVKETINTETAGDSTPASEAAKTPGTAADEAVKGLLSEDLTAEAKSFEKRAGGKTDSVQIAAMIGCVVLDVPGIVSKTARAYQMIQLVKYGFVFLSLADAIKSGDATPEAMSAAGSLLTDVFKDKQGNLTNGAATDGFGIKNGLFGDTSTSGFKKDYRDKTPGGSVGAKAGNISIVTSSPAIKSTCSAIGSNEATLAMQSVEAALAPETLGLSWLIIHGIGGIAAGAAAGGLISKAVEFVAPKIIDHIPVDKLLGLFMGDLTKDLKGEDVGNALVSGSANMMSQTANAGGNAPMSLNDALAYQQSTNEVNLAYAREDQATLSPMDASNPNTFMGSIATQLIPYTSNLASVSGALTSFGSIFNQSMSQISGLTSAASDANARQALTMCPDTSIANSGIAAGPFCDIQYGIPPQYLDENPETVIANLGAQINEDTGEPVDGSKLADWVANCSTGSTIGITDCQITDQTSAEYSLYTIDHRIQVSMDEEPSADGTNSPSSATTPVTGDTKSLAKQLIDSPNIQFQTPQEKTDFQQIVDTGAQTACGGSVPISSNLLSLILTASQKYKLTLGVVASGHSCNGGYHPKGQAVDINGVASLSQPFLRMFDWTSSQSTTAVDYYQFLDSTAGTMGIRLELGQQGCFKGASPKLTNTSFVADTCNHIHVGVTTP